MKVRIRLAPAPHDLFAAPSMESVGTERMPMVGDCLEVESGSFSVVKVMGDVNPEIGSDERGPIAYVVKSGNHPSAREWKVDEAARESISERLRACMARATAARANCDSEQYRKHVEEFLFLSHACGARIRATGQVSMGERIPHLMVFGGGDGASRLLRDALIEHSFAAHVESVSKLEALSQLLDRAGDSRSRLFIITSRLDLQSGLTALHRIRKHKSGAICPIMVLTHQERESDRILAMSAGADAYASFPDSLDDYPQLIRLISEMLGSKGRSATGAAQ